MAAPLVKEALDLLDREFITGLYTAISVPTERLRNQLRQAHKPFVDPLDLDTPTSQELDQTAEWVIERACSSAMAVGGFAGIAGVVTIPPEALATAINTVRLCQRLAVVYGVDPETDRGKMLLLRALAAGFEIKMPSEGPMGLRTHELAPNGHSTVGGVLAHAVIKRSAWMIARRISRLIPVVSSGFAAVSAQRRIR
ncbi:MAG: EcsC family protein, partial [Proteobacteria bacterium]|nr:EcsC family protein [Pseudomonadota bacterium]